MMCFVSSGEFGKQSRQDCFPGRADPRSQVAHGSGVAGCKHAPLGRTIFSTMFALVVFFNTWRFFRKDVMALSCFF